MMWQSGIDECVVDSDRAYVEAAVRIANTADLRASIRKKMLAARDELFEDQRAITQLADFFAELA